jgi:hypothetical protein
VRFFHLLTRRMTDELVVVNIVTNKVSRLLGKEENGRWLNLALYQGAPKKKGMLTTVGPPPTRSQRVV